MPGSRSPRRRTAGGPRLSPGTEAERPRGARPVPFPRRAARLAAAIAVALAVMLGGAFTGALAGTAPAHRGVDAQPGAGLHVTIDSVSPDVGRPGKTVTVTGHVINDGRSPAQGLTASLQSSPNSLQYRGQLDDYADGRYPADRPASATVNLPDVAPGGSARWRLSFQPGSVGIQQFGVYPLAAQVGDVTGATATARTFLPYWPGSASAVRKVKIAWIWPLIDQPRQGACPAMLDNSLASSVDPARDGRLGGLLQAGRSGGRSARITWAVDPALLADVNAMTHQYGVLDGPRCGDVRQQPASGAAQRWLAALRSTFTPGGNAQPVFTTPFADVDASALTHDGLDTDLRNAFAAGQSETASVLGQRLDTAGGGASGGTAWPPGGEADSSMLDNLAVNGVRTTVLAASAMPPVNQTSYTPDAVTRVATGVGSDVRVLLADDNLSTVLGGSGAAAGSSPAQTEQWFLAETAMIAAEAPGLSRSVVVAPPRHWDPSAALAAGLLSDTATAPWLQPEYLGSLTAAPPPAAVTRTPLPGSQRSPDELSSGYLSAIKPIDASVQRFASVLSRPNPLYPQAIARTESWAWRGRGQAAGRSVTGQVGRYLANEEAKVRVINSPGVTLSGARGKVPVSIHNGLPRGTDVTVKLDAEAAANPTVPAAKRLTLGNGTGRFVQTVTVTAGGSQTIKVPVHPRSPGTTQVYLRLLTPDGKPLSARPTVLKVQSTPLGLVAEVITGVAIAVMVLTSIIRVVRRGLREGRPPPPAVPDIDSGLEPSGLEPSGTEAGATEAGATDGSSTQAVGGGLEASGTAAGAQWGGGGPGGIPTADAGPVGPAGPAEGADPADTAYPSAFTSPTGFTYPAGFADPAWSADPAGAAGSTADPEDFETRAGTAGAPEPAGPADPADSGDGAGTVMTEDGTDGNEHGPYYPAEEPDEFADAWTRAQQDKP